MVGSTITEETFIRDIPDVLKRKLYADLDIENYWERLAEQIPRKNETIFQCQPLDADFDPRYTSISIAGFDRAGRKTGGSSTKSLLREWGTINSQVKHLILALKRAKLFKPVKTLEQQLLKSGQEPGQKNEETHQQNDVSQTSDSDIVPQATINPQSQIETCVPLRSSIPVQSDRVSLISGGDQSVVVGEPQPEDTEYPDAPDFSQFHCIDFDILKKITNNFDHRLHNDGGRIIGEGGFGDVYLGTFHNSHKVAIKRLKHSTDELTQEEKLDNIKQFQTEVEILSKYKHKNVVLLLGYSIHNDIHCLVYQFMENGSLEERLAQRFNSPPLSVAMRLEITKGTARGIAYLNVNGLVHRDIKSANILLDNQFEPKIGDFATAKVVPNSALNKTFEMHVSKVIGTAAYIAPEVNNFVVHPKLDTYSFGVVLLEILTGLPVIDEERKNPFLKCHVQEFCYIPEEDEDDDDRDDSEPSGTIFDLLDNSVEGWDETLVNEMYKLSECCLEMRTRKRPKVADILSKIENLSLKNVFETFNALELNEQSEL